MGLRRCIPITRPRSRGTTGQIARPALIMLEDFLGKWVEGMNDDGVHAAVFPNRKERGVVVPPGRLKADLEAELEKYG